MNEQTERTLTDRGTLVLFSAAHICDDVYMNTLPPLVPILVGSAGLSYAAAGILVTFFTVVSSIAQPLFGYLADRYQQKWLGPVGLIWVGMFMGLVGVFRSYPLLMITVMVAGLGPAMFHPHAVSVIADISRNMRGRFMSIFLIGGNLGFAIGPVLVGVVTELFGLRGLVLVSLPGILTGIWLMKYAPRRRSPAERIVSRLVLKDLALVSPLLTVSVLRHWYYFSVLSFVPSYFVSLGESILVANSYLSFMLLTGVAGQFAGGMLSDRYGRKEVTIISLLCSALLLMVFLHTPAVLSVIVLFLMGFSVMSSFSVTLVMIQEMMSRNIGVASGLMIGLGIGLGGVGVLITGLLADMLGLYAALHLLILLPLAAGVLAVFVPYPAGSAAE